MLACFGLFKEEEEEVQCGGYSVEGTVYEVECMRYSVVGTL